MANQARYHLAGDPFFRRMQRKFLTRPYDDPDLREAGFSDEDMGRYAEDVLESAGLPRDRLAVMNREVLSLRDIARERSIGAGQIQLIQNLGHTLDPLTFYAADPVRYCYCESTISPRRSATPAGRSSSKHSRVPTARAARHEGRKSSPLRLKNAN